MQETQNTKTNEIKQEAQNTNHMENIKNMYMAYLKTSPSHKQNKEIDMRLYSQQEQ